MLCYTFKATALQIANCKNIKKIHFQENQRFICKMGFKI